MQIYTNIYVLHFPLRPFMWYSSWYYGKVFVKLVSKDPVTKPRPRRIIRRAELSQNQEGYETIIHVQSQFTPNTKPFELCMLIVLLWLINYLIHYSYSLCSLLLNSNCAENGISVFHSLIKVPTSQLFITKSMLHVWKYEHLNIPLQIFVNSQSTREINIFEVDPF